MKKSKKQPAIASQWRESKAAQDRAEQEVERQRRRQARAAAMGSVFGFFRQVGVRVGSVICYVIGAFLAVALATYTPTDPGFTVTGGTMANNMAGLWGAWSADFLYWLFGRSAWWVPAAFLISGFRLMRLSWAHPDDMQIRWTPVLTVLGLVFLLTASSALEAMQLSYLKGGLPWGEGGVYGQMIMQTMLPNLGLVGATFLALIGVACGMSFVFRFSWFDVAENIGFSLESMVLRLVQRNKEASQTKAAKKKNKENVSSVTASGESEGALPAPEKDHLVVEGYSEKGPSIKEQAEAMQGKLFHTPREDGRILPSMDDLALPPSDRVTVSEEEIAVASRLIESKLQTYRINAKVVKAQAGPVITQYWLELAPGVKGSSVEDIRKDLMRSLAVSSVRIVPVIPGQSCMGLEIPNTPDQRSSVYLREIIADKAFDDSKSPLTLALGKDITGDAVTIDLARMPHLLVGGTTGSGKSVCINSMILSLLYRNDPTQLRLVLIDPKSVEFSFYQDIPHLLCPVVTDMSKACNALNWLVEEMERRYRVMSKLNVRSFDSYNERVRKAEADGAPLMDPFDLTPDNPVPHTPLKTLPYVVCVIDELADLMLLNRKQVETQIMRLAQKARAAGIHMILATQRPSADIVTSLIKANIPARICFQVASRYDSQVVLDEVGAQDLLGRGDMLLKRSGHPTQRLQGCNVFDKEIDQVVRHLRMLGTPEYVEAVTEGAPEAASGVVGQGGRTNEADPLYDTAVSLVVEDRKASVSYLQRRLNVGYNRAANLIETMEAAGIVSPASPTGKREILVQSQTA